MSVPWKMGSFQKSVMSTAPDEFAVTNGVANQDRHEIGGQRSSGKLDELGVGRVSRGMVRAVADPEKNLPSRRNADEPPIGPVDDRLRDRRVAEERGPELSLRGERVGTEGAPDDLGEVLVRARARAIRLEA